MASTKKSLLRGLLLSAFPVAALLVGFALVVGVKYGFEPAVALVDWVSGTKLSIVPSIVDAGSHPAGSVIKVSVSATNHSDQSMEIMGATAYCGCTASEGLPVRIASKSSVSLPILIQTANKQYSLSETIFFLLNDDGVVSRIPVMVCAEVKENMTQ